MLPWWFSGFCGGPVVELAGKDGIKSAQDPTEQTDDDPEDHRGDAEDIKIGLCRDGIDIGEIDDADTSAEDQRRGDHLYRGEFFLEHKAAQNHREHRQSIEQNRGNGSIDIINGAVVANGNKTKADPI